MTPIDQTALNVQAVNSQIIPEEGPKALPLSLDFSGTVTVYTLDIQNLQARGYFAMVQTIYLDLSESASNVSVVIGGTGQIIIAKAHTQGYYNVQCPNPVNLTFMGTASSAVVPAILINVPVPGAVWATA